MEHFTKEEAIAFVGKDLLTGWAPENFKFYTVLGIKESPDNSGWYYLVASRQPTQGSPIKTGVSKKSYLESLRAKALYDAISAAFGSVFLAAETFPTEYLTVEVSFSGPDGGLSIQKIRGQNPKISAVYRSAEFRKFCEDHNLPCEEDGPI